MEAVTVWPLTTACACTEQAVVKAGRVHNDRGCALFATAYASKRYMPPHKRYMPHSGRQSPPRPDGAGLMHLQVSYRMCVSKSRDSNNRRGRALRGAVRPTATVIPQRVVGSQAHNDRYTATTRVLVQPLLRPRGCVMLTLHGAPSRGRAVLLHVRR